MVWSKAQRRAACGQAFINYLYENDAHAANDRASVAHFSESPFSRMQDPDDQRVNAPGYPDEDVSFVVDMLKRRDLIGGVDTAEAGLIAAWLTDDGNDCAEKYDGDFQSYLAERNGGGVTNQTTNHFNMDGSTNNQIATGPSARQTMTITSTSSELAQAIRGLVDLLAAQGAFTGREQELANRQSAVVEQLDQPVPNIPMVQSFLEWVIPDPPSRILGAA